eukprot:CAMPEP_0172364782 /NCGR_PEP_ID=MMETSP1060-20121228/7835_1 /TAXON_ID=37318 /ORGANISM="Pseudo-nitzschia pungens, Strain cf. cingulata" /LENGTH=247 /DNA_ID=CAMNT_0013087867 /DNA_START=199 /DNA_END=939 /DNA_ORIENTATION=-
MARHDMAWRRFAKDDEAGCKQPVAFLDSRKSMPIPREQGRRRTESKAAREWTRVTFEEGEDDDGNDAAGAAVSFATILCRAACLAQPGSTEQELGVAAGGLVHPDLLCATVVAAVMAGTGMVAMGGFARFGGEEPFKRVLDERGHGRGSRMSRLVVFVICVVIILVAAAAAVVPVSAGAMMASVPALPASVAHGFLVQLPLSVQNSEQGGALPLLRSTVLVVSLRHDVLVRVTGRLEEQVLVLVAAG